MASPFTHTQRILAEVMLTIQTLPKPVQDAYQTLYDVLLAQEQAQQNKD